jgi:hypothetical protein
MDNKLNLLCLGKNSKLLITPEILKGKQTPIVSSIKIEIPHNLLLYMGLEETRFEKIETSFLFENLKILSKTGAGKNVPAEILFIRFLRLFNYIFILLIITATAIPFLKKRTTKDFTTLFTIPIVLGVVYFFENAIIYIETKTLSIIITAAGFTGAMIFCIILICTKLISASIYTFITFLASVKHTK